MWCNNLASFQLLLNYNFVLFHIFCVCFKTKIMMRYGNRIYDVWYTHQQSYRIIPTSISIIAIIRKRERKSNENSLAINYFMRWNCIYYTCVGFIFAYLLIYLIYNASSEIYVLYALHFPYFLLNGLNLMTYDAYGNCILFNSILNVFVSIGRKHFKLDVAEWAEY